MAKAGYGVEQINPGLLLVEKIYNYIHVRRLAAMHATVLPLAMKQSAAG